MTINGIRKLEQQLERWKENVHDLNKEQIPDVPDLPHEEEFNVETDPVTKDEIIKAIHERSIIEWPHGQITFYRKH